MTTESREVPEHLILAAGPLKAIDGIEILDSWAWFEAAGLWALRFQTDLGAKINPLVPQRTEWYVLVTDRYPVGRIRVLPASERGLVGTFHHQLFSSPSQKVPWTWGVICVDIPGYLLDRLVPTPEPFSVNGRLAWHVSRAKKWLQAAASDDLVKDGERFELPDFPTGSKDGRMFAFAENTKSLPTWASVHPKNGLANLTIVTLENRQRTLPLTFLDTKGQTLKDVQWGNFIPKISTLVGAWVLLPNVPVLSPWQAPSTWGELFETASNMGVDLQSALIRPFEKLRDGQDHILLLGFPIPEVIGGPPYRIHWQAIELPKLSTMKEASRGGFRRVAERAMHLDIANVLARGRALKWLESKNWDRRPWGSRGHLKASADKNVVIIGLGAIGSAVAEMLVRGGVEHVILIDGDEVEAGNLVRHTLTLDDEGRNKASALADRLNRVSPHARVAAITSYLDPREPLCRRAIEQADLVIDCTANRDVLAEMHAFSWQETTILVSLSIGLNAERVYIYSTPGWSFSVSAFDEILDPLVREDYDSHPEFELPQEDAGCWHPQFPARSDEIWFVSSLAVKEVEDLLENKPTRAELRLIRFDGQLQREVVSPYAG